MNRAREEKLVIEAGGAELPGRLFLPTGKPAVACVIHGATGVPRDYYAEFARWVAAERGAACLIYAYRDSALPPAELRRSRASMADWGVRDQNAALNALRARFPRAELRVIGHSLGGFMTMFHERAGEVAVLSAVCSGPAWWRRSPWPQRALAWALWYLIGPVAVRLFGYLPRWTGIGADVPAPAFRQWRRWCTNPDLHRPDWGRALPEPDLGRFRGRLRLIAAADDWMIPPPVVHDLARFYPAAAEVERITLDPARIGRPIGHLAAFRPSAARAWPTIWGA